MNDDDTSLAFAISYAKLEELRSFEREIVEWVKETTGAERPLVCHHQFPGALDIGVTFSSHEAATLFRLRWC